MLTFDVLVMVMVGWPGEPDRICGRRSAAHD
jgi:hypothetical protein